MSFKTVQFSPGVLLPEELALVEVVFDTITSNEWFIEDEVKRREFANYVIATYHRGLTDPEKLQRFCQLSAERKFRKGNTASGT